MVSRGEARSPARNESPPTIQASRQASKALFAPSCAKERDIDLADAEVSRDRAIDFQMTAKRGDLAGEI